MVEFLIAATTVLIPLFLIVPLLGKYMDMKAAAIQAARYAAWERTVYFGHADWAAAQKTDVEIQQEIQQRFFSNTATSKLLASDKNTTGWPTAGPKPLWVDRGGSSMLVTYNSDVRQAGQKDETPGLINAIFDPITDAISALGGLLGAAFVLDMDSQYTSTVTVTTALTREIRQQIGRNLPTGHTQPIFSEKNVLIANGWSANGAAHVKAQTEGLVPLSFLQRSPISDITAIIQYVAAIIAPELAPDYLKLGGVIQPDVVPDDRLK
jgi:hypothetical protein